MASCCSSSDESPPSPLPLPLSEIESLEALHLEGNCLTLKSRDEKEFVITRAMAMQCETLRRHIIECHDDTRIIIPVEFDSYYVERVIQYLRKHANVEAGDDLKAFNKEFVTNNTNDDLCALLAAAYELKAEDLFRLVGKRFSSLVAGRTPEELQGR